MKGQTPRAVEQLLTNVEQLVKMADMMRLAIEDLRRDQAAMRVRLDRLERRHRVMVPPRPYELGTPQMRG